MFVNHTLFHRQKFTGDLRTVYDTIANTIHEKKTTLVLPSKFSPDLVSEIINGVYNDNPAFFYFNPTRYMYAIGSRECTFEFEYIYHEREIIALEKELGEIMKRFWTKYAYKAQTDYDKAKLIHNYLVGTVRYDISDPSKLSIFSVTGALRDRVAVCWGIALAYKLLADYLKLKCFVIEGNDDTESDEGHAWNIVKIDGNNYHVDATWDLRTKGCENECYNYYNVNDQELARNHSWNRIYYPQCTSTQHNFFYLNNGVAHDLTKAKQFIYNSLLAGRPSVHFKLACGMPSDEVMQATVREVAEIYMDTAKVAKLAWTDSSNSDMNIVSLSFERT
jgi:hypothetical protein